MTDPRDDIFGPYAQGIRDAEAAEAARHAAFQEQIREAEARYERENRAAVQASGAAAERLRSAGIPFDCRLAVEWRSTFQRQSTYAWRRQDLSYSATFDFSQAWLVQAARWNDEGSPEADWVFLQDDGTLRYHHAIGGRYSPDSGYWPLVSYTLRAKKPHPTTIDAEFPKLIRARRSREVWDHTPYPATVPKLLAEMLHRHGLL